MIDIIPRQHDSKTENHHDHNGFRYRNNGSGRRPKMDPLSIDINSINDENHQRTYNRQRDCMETPPKQTKNRNKISNNNRDDDGCYYMNNDNDFQFGNTTYRHDGFSIGNNYLRLDGKTITRGELVSDTLTVAELLGEGNFSRVYKGLWRKTTAASQKRTFIEGKGSTFEEHNKRFVDGSCAENYRGDDQNEIVTVAIKQCSVLDVSIQRKNMLIKELRILCQLQSDGLVGFYGAFLQDNDVVLVMEYMNTSLEQWRRNKGRNHKNLMRPPSSTNEAFFSSVAYQVLVGLEYLHGRRMIHRDIKPGNILLNTNDGSVKLCDFGIASIYGEDDYSLQTTIVGSNRFMSPERLRGKSYGKSSDIWSFGLVLFELWNDTIPFQDCDSIVSLVVTVEETSIDDLVCGPSQFNPSTKLQEVLRGSLQQIPSKRIPASVLRQAPWFTVQHQMTTIDDARFLMLESSRK